MQTQHQRDEKTLAIATALGLFVLALAVGMAARRTTSLVYDVGDSIDTAFDLVMWGAAVLAPTAYLLRTARR